MSKLKLVTHSGRFHADDAFATAVLSLLFKKTGQEFEVIRSRDPKDIELGDIVYDNGNEYDPDQKRFDHHQEGGAGVRDNGVPYAAFGLIWKHYGHDLIEKYFQESDQSDESNEPDGADQFDENVLDQATIEQIHELVDKKIVQPVDASDTGYEDFKPENKDLRTYVMDSIANSFNPASGEGYEKSYELFMEVSALFERILQRELLQAKTKVENFYKVEQAYQEAEDKRIIILYEGGPWKEVLIEKPEPLYVIFPTVDSDGFIIQAVMENVTGHEVRKPFPENWRGKRNDELQKETEVEGSKFCHSAGFLCVTDTKEQAEEIAKIAVDN